MAKLGYVPSRGDIVWIDFDPTKGHEQSGRRPAIVVSPQAYNAKARLALVCQITSQAKGYPFEVAFKTRAVQGVILADQIRSMDWRKRRAEKAGRASDSAVSEVQSLLQKLVTE